MWYTTFLGHVEKVELTRHKDLFYIPFYFQSAQLSSATSSGVKAIPLGLAQVIAIVLVGALVTRFGQYVRRRSRPANTH